MTTPRRRRIVAIGDSTTAGTPGFRSPLEAPPDGRGDETSQYAWWLMCAHPTWLVMNRGVNGERSDQIRARFDRDLFAAGVEAVVLIAGVNDVYQGRPASHVQEQLRWMYDRAAGAGIPLVAGTILPYDTATPDANVRMHEINAWIRQQEMAPQLRVVETRAAVSPPDGSDRLADSPDGLHPSPAGYRAMAEAIRPALEQILR